MTPRAAPHWAPWDPLLSRLGRQSLGPQAPSSDWGRDLPQVLSGVMRPMCSAQALAAHRLHGRPGTTTRCCSVCCPIGVR